MLNIVRNEGQEQYICCYGDIIWKSIFWSETSEMLYWRLKFGLLGPTNNIFMYGEAKFEWKSVTTVGGSEIFFSLDGLFVNMKIIPAQKVLA